MKQIIKAKEPISMLIYRKQAHAHYEDYRHKDELRQSLLEEQGYICCYCMQRISAERMKIEHCKPQSQYPELQLDYHNLLAACEGNEGNSRHLQHCDTHKGDKKIAINPADSQKNCEQYLKYSSNGRIYSDATIIDKDLNNTLNLNTQTLVNNRQKALNTVIKELTMIKGKRAAWQIQAVYQKIQTYETKAEDKKYKPYCQMIVYFLKKRFRKELTSMK
jgi:uncharacterized protein (TIGR02646 family)